MKLRKLCQMALAAAASLGLGLWLSACSPSNTIGFLYVTASRQNPGQINVYSIDGESGVLRQLVDSPYSSGGRNPVADATSPNGKNLYVINHDDNTIVMFAIGTDGKLYPLQTCNMPGTFPIQLMANAAGTYLYVVETFQPNFNVSVPGPGALVAFPINANGELGATSSLCVPVANGTNSFFPAGNGPAAVNVLANNNFVYVANQGDPSIYAYQVGSNGALTQIGTYSANLVAPNAITSDPANKFLYVTDSSSNQIIGFAIQSNGTLTPMQPQQTFSAGNLPDAIKVDPRGKYLLVANYNANNVTPFLIDPSTGNLSPNSSTPAYAVGTGPTCLLIDPALGQFVYTTNFLNNNVSGLFMSPTTGALSAAQGSPVVAAGQPTCPAAITHGHHVITP
jgi:6-phosphogluconolactonase (cycloisomerase 2 family)